MIEGSFRKGKAINLDNLTVEETEKIETYATNIADMIINPSDYDLVEGGDGSQPTLYDEFNVFWLESTDEYAVVCGYEVLFDGFDSESEALKVHEYISNMAHVIANKEMLKLTVITEQERKIVNKYFSEMESGWTLENDVEVLVTDNMVSVAKYLGHDVDGLNDEEIETLIDVNYVWFDGENTCNYYIIVQ